jgi:hypothetical protein
MTIQTPPPPKTNKKGEPPTLIETRENLKKPEPAKIVPLNFRVPFEFKKDFKVAAAMNGITQSKLLQQAFEEWRRRHG